VRSIFIALALAVAAASASFAVESPTSSGPASVLDTPIFRIPFTEKPPKIDGVMEEREWENASALSSFWYDYTTADFRFLAPVETQLQVYGCYDKENLYIAYSSPVYPLGSWLKARGRFPDVHHHPLYGIIWDDHIELEIRPYHDNVKGFRMGLFKWFVNPIATVADQSWSLQKGEGSDWQSKMTARCQVTPGRWTLEMAIPLKQFVHGNYAWKDSEGNPVVKLPPPAGTAYRVWFTRAIGGNGPFFNAFDAHVWNTTKTKMIFDPKCVSFQVNELGPIMQDVIDLHLTVKNHNSRSETVRLGFFVESAEGLIYSSYEDEDLKDGLLELVPGEVRELRLKKPFPGITQAGNVLWFDVRSAGRPAKPIFQTRLVRFHAQDFPRFKERRIDIIAELRPPRKDFDFRYNYSSYTNRLASIVDTGIYGGSEKARRAVEAKLTVLDADQDDKAVATGKAQLHGAFACLLLDMPTLVAGHRHSVSLLLFDENKRIVGEDNTGEFLVGVDDYTWETDAFGGGALHFVPMAEWKGNKLGLDDVVWEPFVPIEIRQDGFETLKHRFTLGQSGLPEQIYIKPDPRDLPLEKRGEGAELTDEELRGIGRGPQLRGPLRFVVTAGGKRYDAAVVEKAKLVRQWKSEVEYASKLKAGPLDLALLTRYDCDGSLHCKLTYGADKAAEIEAFEMLTDVAGNVDLVASAMSGGGMAGSDRWECTLPEAKGIVWDSADLEAPELYYTHFVPFIYFGSADRGMTWYADSDRYWRLDRDGSAMTLERDGKGQVSWRVKFVNHKTMIEGHRTLDFHVLVHPAKPKPKDYRKIAWHYRGDTWAEGYQVEPVELSEDYLKRRWHRAASAPRNLRHEKADTWRKDSPPWVRFGRWRNTGIAPEMNQRFEDKAVFYLGRQIRVGRRSGWWWDEYWPVGFGRSENLAAGTAYVRDPETVRENELPWQSGYLSNHMRRAQKRLARIFAESNVPQRQFHWANGAATCYESFSWDCQLVEECGSDPRSYDLDVVTQFPNSLWRYEAHNFTGLVARVVPRNAAPNNVFSRPGDDKRLDRQYLGRALINDIGVCFDGPHGCFQHNEQALRFLGALADFGYFEDEGTEFIPYWRNQPLVLYGKGRTKAIARDALDIDADEEVYVSLYRRPADINGRKGYKVLLVIMNEADEDVHADLRILDAKRIFGGPNNLTLREALADCKLPEGAAGDMIAAWAEDAEDLPVLKDLESGGFVARRSRGEERYESVYVPRHDYRILYGHHLAGE